MATSTTTRTTRAFTLTSFKAATDELIKKAIDSDTELINVGSLPIFHKILSEEGVIGDLRNSFGNDEADVIFSLAACLVETGQLSSQFFDGWKTNRYLPLNIALDQQKLANFLTRIGIAGKEAQSFFTTYATRTKDEPVIVYATSFQEDALLWPSARLTSEVSHSPMGGLLTAVSSKTGLPILLHSYPGITKDFRAFLGFLVAIKEMGIGKIKNVVLGPEFFSEEALLRASEAHAKCVFILPTSAQIYREFLPHALERFEAVGSTFKRLTKAGKNPAVTTTYPTNFITHGHKVSVWIHFMDNTKRKYSYDEGLYRELDQFERLWESQPELRAVLEAEPLMKYFSISSEYQGEEIISKLIRVDRKIEADLLRERLVGVVTTWECSADECLEELAVEPQVKEMVNQALTNTLEGENPARQQEDGMLFLSYIATLMKESLRLRIKRAEKENSQTLGDWDRLDSNQEDTAKVIGAMDGYSYLRRKANKTLIPLPVNSKQKKAVELCGLSGILDAVYEYSTSLAD